MKRIIILALLLFAVSVQAQDYRHRYFHYNQYFDAPVPFAVMANTADGGDNNRICLSGGGACLDVSRGASLQIAGNEDATYPGHAILAAGNTGGGGNIYFRTGSAVNRLSIPYVANGNDVTLALGETNPTAPSFTIRGNTSDGDDDATLNICPGGACASSTRGGWIQILGNEAAGGGDVSIYSGSTADSDIFLIANNATGDLVFGSGGNTNRWYVEADGDFAQDVTNGGDLVMSQTDEFIIHGLSSVHADVTDSLGNYGAFYRFGTGAALIAARGDAGTAPAYSAFVKSRATDGSANTVLNAYDQIGQLDFWGAGGALFHRAASIDVLVDGTPGNNDMPGRIRFSTSADGTATPLGRWAISTGAAKTMTLIAKDDTNDDITALIGISPQNGDGHDEGSLSLAGGGSNATSRGAYILLQGNEASGAGDVQVNTGSAAGSAAVVDVASADGLFYIKTGSSALRWQFEADGDLAQDATNGGNLVFQRDLYGIIDSTEPTAAAGGDLAGATTITAVVTLVTGADAAKGVKFPAAPIGGQRYVIYNTENAVLKVYPGEAGDQINAAGAGVAVNVAAYANLYCHASSASQIWCGEMANP